MKKHLLLIIFLCPVSILNSECEELDINEGHLYHIERESFKDVSKSLQEVLGEDSDKIHSRCFENENQESIEI